MTKVQAIYLRARRLDSVLLRTALWSPWSHVATIMPGGSHVIDATLRNGVAQRTLAAVQAHASKYEIREWEVPDASAGYIWLRSQIGKPYDLKGCIGIGLHQHWQDEDSWFCSELHEAFLAKCGLKRFIVDAGRVTPQHSWMVV